MAGARQRVAAIPSAARQLGFATGPNRLGVGERQEPGVNRAPQHPRRAPVREPGRVPRRGPGLSPQG